MAQLVIGAMTAKERFMPVMLVPTASDILREINTDIQRIKATGSRMSSSKMYDRPDYGFEVTQKNSSTAEIDYHKKTDNNGKAINPITKQVANNIVNEIDQTLKSAKPKTPDYQLDIPVQKVVIEVQSRELALNYGTGTKTFFIVFELENIDNTDGIAADKAMSFFESRSLFEQGFKTRIPVLKQIIHEDDYSYGKDSHESLYEWDKTNINTDPLVPSDSGVITTQLPENIGFSSEFRQTEEEYWEML